MTMRGLVVRTGLAALWAVPALAGASAGEVSLASQAQVISRIQVSCMVPGPKGLQPYTQEEAVPGGGRKTLAIPLHAVQITVTIWYLSDAGWKEFRSLPVTLPPSRTVSYTLTGTQDRLELK